MTTLQKIDKLIEVYENPEEYPIETMFGLCHAWRKLFAREMPKYVLDRLWLLARNQPEYTGLTHFFPVGATAPRLEILKQYRKQLTDGITKHEHTPPPAIR